MKNGLSLFVIFSLLLAVNASAAVQAGIDIEIESSTLCPCSTLSAEDFKVFVTNMDSRTQEYEFSLTLPDNELWSGFIVPNESFTGDETKSVAAFVTPSCWVKPGIYRIGVNAVSPVSGEMTTRNFDVEVLKCRWVNVATEEYEICQEDISYAELTFTNEGDNDENVKLSTDTNWAVFAEETLEISGGEEKTVKLLFKPPEEFEGETIITLNMESEISYMRNREDMVAIVKNCHETEFTVEPVRQDVCPCQTADFSLEIKNAGIMEDEYTIMYGDQSSVMSVADNGTGMVALSIEVPCDKEEGEYPLQIAIDSNDPVNSTVVVGVLPSLECYNAYLYSDDAVNVKPVGVGESDTYEMFLANRGKFDQSYSLGIEAPEWVHMSDYEAYVAVGGEEVFYVYAAPEYEVEAGGYPVYVGALGENDGASIEFEVVVVSNFTVTEEEVETVDEVSEETEEVAEEEQVEDVVSKEEDTGSEDISIEVDTSIPTGEVVSEDNAVSEKPWSQVVMISILAVAVVFVLVLRFVVMMK